MRSLVPLVCLVAGCQAMADPPPPLPDLEASAQRGRCERPPVGRPGASAVGADQTYVGTFSIDDAGRVTGTETRLLFANSAWKTTTAPDGTRGADCKVVWNVSGTRVPARSCQDCAFGITFEANIDYGASTCPMRIQADGNHFRGAYDVKVAPDGRIEVFFATSGNALGAGMSAGDTYTWASPHRCVWL